MLSERYKNQIQSQILCYEIFKILPSFMSFQINVLQQGDSNASQQLRICDRLSGTSQYQCQICHQIYRGISGSRNLKCHLLKAHNLGKPFECLCGKTFSWDALFYKHRKFCPVANREKN